VNTQTNGKTANGNGNGNGNISVAKYCTSRVPTAKPEETLGDVQQRICANMRNFDTVDYIYVLDNEEKLVNIFSVRALYSNPPQKRVGSMSAPKKLCTVKEGTDRERAAYLALKYHITSVPILYKNGCFAGVIDADAIHRILYNELREDLMRFAGIRHMKSVTTSALQTPIGLALKHRLPWLLLGMAGGILSAGIIDLFEETLKQYLLLAAFIPLIVFTTNAVALQMTAFLIRDLATETDLPFGKYVLHELRIAAVLAIVCGMLLTAIVHMLYGDPKTSIVLGLGLFCGILTSIFTGTVVPYTFYRLKLDPADASGPIGTIIQDNVSIVIYFSIAAWML